MLDKRSRNILIVFGIVIFTLLVTEIVRPKPINWRPSYTKTDKTPFGAEVFYKELPQLFSEASFEEIEEDPFVFLQDETYQENSAYFFLNDQVFFDQQQVAALRDYVSNGNTVFISAMSYGYILADSLETYARSSYGVLEEAIGASLLNPSLQTDSVPAYKRGVFKTVFSEIDTLNTTALGYFTSEENKLDALNFVKVTHGDGEFYLHTLPQAFSNYYLLQDNEAYAAGVLSYIDADHIYLDTYLKSGRKIVTSPMRFIFNQLPLKWAYYVLMAGLLVFVLFRGKREQRVIEVIEPVQNTSVEFTRTIGDLYFQHKDFGNIIAKKITYFLEMVRSNYYLNTNELTNEFIKKLAVKSGNDLQETQALIQYIKQLKGKAIHTENDLIQLNKQIEEFTS